VGTLIEVVPEAKAREKLGVAVVADDGYFAVEQIGQLQRCGVRAVIADPHEGRRRRDAPLEHRQTLRRAACATRSESGKALLRKRGEHLERGFAHVLDHGGLRRATVRGCENLTKRHLIAALSFNLSLLLRTMFASGTTKQWLAGPLEIIFRSMGVIDRLLEALLGKLGMYLRALVLITDSDAEGKSGQLQPARSGVNQQAVRRL
jgi:hypothetical protein